MDDLSEFCRFERIGPVRAIFKRAEFLDEGQGDADLIVHPPRSTAGLSAEKLLDAYGISMAPIKLARSLEDAEAAGHELGYPLVMKIAAPDILHKSDVGGVVLNIQDTGSLLVAYAQMLERVQKALPSARIDGVYLQRQIPLVQESSSAPCAMRSSGR